MKKIHIANSVILMLILIATLSTTIKFTVKAYDNSYGYASNLYTTNWLSFTNGTMNSTEVTWTAFIQIANLFENAGHTWTWIPTYEWYLNIGPAYGEIKYWGAPTDDEVYDQIDHDVEDHSDFSTALYLGHGGPSGFYGYTDYPNDPDIYPDLIYYSNIESQLDSSPTFQFAFNWVCFSGNDAPDGAPSSWNPMWWDDPSEYSYTWIGFDNASPWIIDYMSSQDTMKNWLVFFYYHALNGNSIMTSLDYASDYCNFDDFAATPLAQGSYKMYWPWSELPPEDPEAWFSGEMHFEGNVTTTYLPTDFYIGGPLG
jgi:hypothetical protein